MQLGAAACLIAACIGSGGLLPLRASLGVVFAALIADDALAAIIEGLRVLAGAISSLKRLSATFPELAYTRPVDNGVDALLRLLLPSVWHPARRCHI